MLFFSHRSLVFGWDEIHRYSKLPRLTA